MRQVSSDHLHKGIVQVALHLEKSGRRFASEIMEIMDEMRLVVIVHLVQQVVPVGWQGLGLQHLQHRAETDDFGVLFGRNPYDFSKAAFQGTLAHAAFIGDFLHRNIATPPHDPVGHLPKPVRGVVYSFAQQAGKHRFHNLDALGIVAGQRQVFHHLGNGCIHAQIGERNARVGEMLLAVAKKGRRAVGLENGVQDAELPLGMDLKRLRVMPDQIHAIVLRIGRAQAGRKVNGDKIARCLLSVGCHQRMEPARGDQRLVQIRIVHLGKQVHFHILAQQRGGRVDFQ